MRALSASVIILTWNGRDYIEPCLDAVLAQAYEPLEIIVVDNASSDGTAQLVAEKYPSVRLIRNERNLGFPAGNNVGLRAATGEMQVLLNQDTVVRPGWLHALAASLGSDPRIGVVGCKIFYPDGERLQHVGGKVIHPHATPAHDGINERDQGQYDEPREVPFVTGAAVALRREMLEQIGLLDEDFFLYYEDTDLCFRARAAGYRVLYEPEAVLTHVESATGARESQLYYHRIHRSRWRFILKHYGIEDILTGSVASDEGWLSACTVPERRGLAAAYRDVQLHLPEILAARVAGGNSAPTEQERQQLAAALQQLRELAWQVPEPLVPEPLVPEPLVPEPFQEEGEKGQGLLDLLLEKWEIREVPFVSHTPYIGPLIVRVREAWNSVSTKWYTRALLDQQNLFNQIAVQQMSYLARQISYLATQISYLATQISYLATKLTYQREQLERQLQKIEHRTAWLANQDQEQVRLMRQMMELSAQVEQMGQTLARIEARLAGLERQDEDRTDRETKEQEGR